MLEFRILGPVQVVRDGRELGLGGPRRRAVLALLLVAGGRVVPAERLAGDLWGDSPPPGAAGTLRTHLSRLVPATCDAPERAEFLVAQAEVARLAGAAGQAEAGLLRALQFYQDRQMVVMAERTRALLASLSGQHTTLKP